MLLIQHIYKCKVAARTFRSSFCSAFTGLDQHVTPHVTTTLTDVITRILPYLLQLLVQRLHWAPATRPTTRYNNNDMCYNKYAATLTFCSSSTGLNCQPSCISQPQQHM
jgi:hypothetical protein